MLAAFFCRQATDKPPPSPGPPSAAPVSAATYLYGGGLYVGVEWVNGDATAWTQVAYAASSSVFTNYPAEGDPLDYGIVGAPGDTSYETGSPVALRYYHGVRHYKNGEYSAWTVADL